METAFEIGEEQALASALVNIVRFSWCYSGAVDDGWSFQHRIADYQQADREKEAPMAKSETTGVNNPTELQQKSSRRNIRCFFKSAQKTTTKPLIRCRQTKTESPLPQENLDLSKRHDPGLKPDPESVPGPSGLQNVTSTDQTVPKSSPVRNISDYELNSSECCQDTCSFQNRMADNQQADWEKEAPKAKTATEQPPPQTTGVNNPTELPQKSSRRNIRSFFKSARKTMKKPFIRCRQSKTESPLPQENPDPSKRHDPGLKPDPESVPAPSGLQNVTGTDQTVPKSSPVRNISDYELNSSECWHSVFEIDEEQAQASALVKILRFFLCYSGGIDDTCSFQYRMADNQQADREKEALKVETATEQPPPQAIGVNNPTELPQKSSRRNIQSAWKTMKKPFIRSRQSKTESPLPHENPDPSKWHDPGLKPDPGFRNVTGTDPTLPKSSSVQNISDYEPNSRPMNKFYSVGDVLGCGSFGTVYKGTRKSDGEQVAIKRISRRAGVSYECPPDSPKSVFKEAVMMVMLRRPPISPYVIEMFEWFDHCHVISLILEYPKPCQVLSEFVSIFETLSEQLACSLMHQLVQAVQHCISCRVFHNDIHSDNILVNTVTSTIKLIDFGNAHLLDPEGYDTNAYVGPLLYWPPEAFTEDTYHAIPTNVWALGITLSFMVNGNMPFLSHQEIENNGPTTWIDDLSTECRDLIDKCLNKNPVERLTLEQILLHEWFNVL